jgi:hypothetical protein
MPTASSSSPSSSLSPAGGGGADSARGGGGGRARGSGSGRGVGRGGRGGRGGSGGGGNVGGGRGRRRDKNQAAIDSVVGGFLSIDKPPGISSHDAVDAARSALQLRRVGHAGTLDPFASGVLVVGTCVPDCCCFCRAIFLSFLPYAHAFLDNSLRQPQSSHFIIANTAYCFTTKLVDGLLSEQTYESHLTSDQHHLNKHTFLIILNHTNDTAYGFATKLVDGLLSEKTYRACIRLGVATDTLDIDGARVDADVDDTVEGVRARNAALNRVLSLAGASADDAAPAVASVDVNGVSAAVGGALMHNSSFSASAAA